MALTGNGILGGVRGKIANIQGSGWKGKHTIQGWNDRKGLVYTQPQLNQQSIMLYARKYSTGTKFIASLMYVKKKQKNIGEWAYNCKTFLNNTLLDGTINFATFQWGRKVLDRRVFFISPILPFVGGWSMVVNPSTVETYQGENVVWTMFWWNVTQQYTKEVSVTFDHNAQLYLFNDTEMVSGDLVYFIGFYIVEKLGFQSEYGVNGLLVP